VTRVFGDQLETIHTPSDSVWHDDYQQSFLKMFLEFSYHWYDSIFDWYWNEITIVGIQTEMLWYAWYRHSQSWHRVYRMEFLLITLRNFQWWSIGEYCCGFYSVNSTKIVLSLLNWNYLCTCEPRGGAKRNLAQVWIRLHCSAFSAYWESTVMGNSI